MRVLVRVPGKPTIRLRLPTALLCSRLTASIAARILQHHAALAPSLTKEALYELLQEIRRCRRRFKPLRLVEVHSADGEEVLVDL